MSILVDLNQVAISNLMIEINSAKSDFKEINEDLVAHMIYNALRGFNRKFGEKYGKLVICADDKDYWRRQLFPQYKASRKKAQRKSTVDWHNIYRVLDSIRGDLKNQFPYKYIQVPHAEADDLIAVLSKHSTEPTIIISGDKDLVQLQKYGIELYNPVKKIHVPAVNPEMYIKELVIRGDEGDGVPNFMSDDDTFVVEGKRQVPLRTTNVNQWLGMEPAQFCDTEKAKYGYARNQRLINLDNVPNEIEIETLRQFALPALGNKTTLFNHFIDKRMRLLLECIQEF